MSGEVKLRPCPWCEGQTKRFQMKTTDGEIVEMVEHQGWPHCCVRRDSMTLAQWQARPTVVTDEVVEALRPFAETAEYADELGLADDDFVECAPFKAGDYRKARAAMAPE